MNYRCGQGHHPLMNTIKAVLGPKMNARERAARGKTGTATAVSKPRPTPEPKNKPRPTPRNKPRPTPRNNKPRPTTPRSKPSTRRTNGNKPRPQENRQPKETTRQKPTTPSTTPRTTTAIAKLSELENSEFDYYKFEYEFVILLQFINIKIVC